MVEPQLPQRQAAALDRVSLALVWLSFRAAEQLVGLPDEIMEDQQRREQQEQDEVEEAGDEGYGGGRLDRQQSGSKARSKSGQETWLEGRMAFAKALMDVGESREVSRSS